MEAEDAKEGGETPEARGEDTRSRKAPAKWFAYTSAASIGLEMAVAIILCSFGGWWVQNHLTHWEPWTMIIGFMVGVGAAANAIFRTIRQHEADVAARMGETGTDPAEPSHGES